ncbi:MAG: hypothetical protein PVI26_00495 [Chitinispirillia bacterium]|jgi:hypothetical protein
MSLSTIVFFYIIIGILALVSIYFSIVNWVKLNRTNEEINRMQIEIGKKIKEFNFKKTEKNEPYQRQNIPAMVHQTTSKTLVHKSDRQPHIEIVRNVRQDFSPDKVQQISGHIHQQGEQTFKQPSDSLNRETAGMSANHNTQRIKDNKEEILDIVNQSNPNEYIKFENNENITIVLYSDRTKDADFKNLRTQINNSLVNPSTLAINIDFNKIYFLYDKELEYLEKISRIVHSQKKSLFFINCNPELRQFIQKNNILKTFLKETQNSQ